MQTTLPEAAEELETFELEEEEAFWLELLEETFFELLEGAAVPQSVQDLFPAGAAAVCHNDRPFQKDRESDVMRLYILC